MKRKSIRMIIDIAMTVLLSMLMASSLIGEKLSRSRKSVWVVTAITLGAVSLYGCYAFIKRQLADYMFQKSVFVFFDFSEPRVYFFLDYIAIMVLFAFLGYLIAVRLAKIEKQNSRKDVR